MYLNVNSKRNLLDQKRCNTPARTNMEVAKTYLDAHVGQTMTCGNCPLGDGEHKFESLKDFQREFGYLPWDCGP